ncbi:MAG TPA: undecaprenyl-diphosphate phosphatase, partial [Acidobacteriota bacterium]
MRSGAELPLALKIVVLALVQGLSEFFPVSSSGHLLLFQKLLNFTTLPLVFDIFF